MPINAEDKALVHSDTGQTRRLAKTDLQRNNRESGKCLSNAVTGNRPTAKTRTLLKQQIKKNVYWTILFFYNVQRKSLTLNA